MVRVFFFFSLGVDTVGRTGNDKVVDMERVCVVDNKSSRQIFSVFLRQTTFAPRWDSVLHNYTHTSLRIPMFACSTLYELSPRPRCKCRLSARGSFRVLFV